MKQAQQTAADAQAAAAKAEADATAQQQAYTENAAAVSTLQSTVTDLKANQLSLATTVSDETTNIKKAIDESRRASLQGHHALATGSFLAAETVWRQGATGGDINTAVYRRSAAELRRLAIERVLRFGPSVAPGLQGSRQAAQR